MSEKIYAWLLRLYSSDFRRAHGEEALQLIRDRARDESGFWPKLRLWTDLFGDVVRSRRFDRPIRPRLAVDGSPLSFQLLEAETPRSSSLLAGAGLSLITLSALPFLISHLGSHWKPRHLEAEGVLTQAVVDRTNHKPRNLSPDRPTPENCGFDGVQMRPHKIGYLKITTFSDAPGCPSTAVAVLASLDQADAIIFDLRENRGGSPDMAALLIGSQLAAKPAFVLISTSTSSTALRFASDLKMLKRATLVGEGTGVEPDVKASTARALDVAEKLAAGHP